MSPKKSKEFKDRDKDTEDMTKYIYLVKDEIELKVFPSKLKIFLKCEFTTPIAIDRVEAYYYHPLETIKSKNNLIVFYADLNDRFSALVDAFQERGRWFVFSKIMSTDVKQYEVSYLKASSYIQLQFKSSNIINVQKYKW